MKCAQKKLHFVSAVVNCHRRVVFRSTQKSFYEEFFGGMVAIYPAQFQKTKGFSNMFWGWGSEDDDLYNR